MVWMFPAAGGAGIAVWLRLIALGDTTHIVVGSVEILYLVFNGTLLRATFSGPSPFLHLPGISAAAPFIFALMSHARITAI